MTGDNVQVRTYGGWRRSRGIGLFGLGTTATFILLGMFAAVLVTVAAWPAGLFYIVPLAAVAAAVTFVRIGGVPAGQHAVQRVRWWRGTRRGHTVYRVDALVARLGTASLPGMLAATELISAEDGYGGHYGLVRDRHTGYLTATLKVIPASTWLAERDDSDGWVAAWGSWLASLGHTPMIRWVSVTADTAPEPGTALADAVAAAADPRAPKAARDILAQLAETAPATAAGVDTRVSLTFDPAASPARPRSLQEAAAEVGRALHGLQVQLGSCGLTVTGRARPLDITAAVRVAFDPGARADASRITASPAGDDLRLAWETAGPGGADELWDRYRHAGGTSVSWAWREAPRSNVHSDVLARLTAPSAWPKRVTLQYRPLPAASATRVLENEVRAAEFRQEYARRTKRDATARDGIDHARARQAAMEEAQGAGVALVSLYVTATVARDREDDLPRAVAAVEAAAGSSKIQLQRLYGSQAAGFCAGLPCGVYLPELARRIRN
jgi:hypothetical protein